MPQRSDRPTRAAGRPTNCRRSIWPRSAPATWNGVELIGTLPDDFDEPLHLTEVRLRRASLIGAKLEGSRFVDVIVTACELSGVDLLEASMTKVVFADSRLSGAQLAQTRLRDVRFVDSRLEDVNFAMATGERVRYETCTLDRGDFRAAKFEGVAWWDCDLTDAEFIADPRDARPAARVEPRRLARCDRPETGRHRRRSSSRPFAEHVLASMGITVNERRP